MAAVEEAVREVDDLEPVDATVDDDEVTDDEAQASGSGLFNRDRYQEPALRIDQVDGQEVDKIKIKFSGSVVLDRTKAEDVALFNRLRLGKEVELRVSGRGARVGTGYTTSKGGDLEAIVGERELKIDTVYPLEPEEL